MERLNKRYAVAYCGPNGETYSDDEPYIEDLGDTIEEARESLTILLGKGCRKLTLFEVKDELDGYTWDYVNKHKVSVD